MKYKVFPSKPYPLGIRREDKDIYASMVSGEDDCGIVLYSSKRGKDTEPKEIRIPFPKEQRIGQVYSMKIEGIPAHYDGYRLYQGNVVLADKYGTCYKYYPFGTSMEQAQMMGVLDSKIFDWEEDKKPKLAFSDAVFYGLHVRGFTMHENSMCRHKGTFAGVKEKLDYLQELGITSIILMPAYEFIEKEQAAGPKTGQDVAGQFMEKSSAHGEKAETFNYWGYKSAFYYAPKASYAAGKNPCTEFKQLVKACHARGMELFMQFYFPEEVTDMEMIRILEYWVMEYHVDGFQIMTERGDIDAIEKAPLLADTKLIFRSFGSNSGWAARNDIKNSLKNGTGKRLCVYRDDIMQDYRRFLKGDNFMLDAVRYHFGKNDASKAYLNSIADHAGFRLADMVSYNHKHNEANGENNTDGTNDNSSWICGAEGPTDNLRILALRKKQIKNALSLILLSQGTPYLFMGDEMGSTQSGNNNPYNQDNEISWLDWNCLTENKEIFEFARALLAFRKENPFLHTENVLDGRDYLGYGYPNISFHGREAYQPENGEDRKELGILLCGEGTDTTVKGKGELSKEKDTDTKVGKLIYVACNMHWLPRELALPRLKYGAEWQIALKTMEKAPFQDASHMEVPARTVVVLEALLKKPDGAEDKHITAF